MPIVAHDAAGDAALLVNECLCVGAAPPSELRRLFARTVCTKLLAVARCRLRAPEALPDALHRRRRLSVYRTAKTVGDATAKTGGGGGGSLKWPSLDSRAAVRANVPPSDGSLASDDAVRCLLWSTGPSAFRPHAAHDARGDVERCRDVLLACVRHDVAPAN